MEHQIKQLVEATENKHLKSIFQASIKALEFENNHLTIYVNNAAPLHELESEDLADALKNALKTVYGEAITYEAKLYQASEHERENMVPHVIHGHHTSNH